MVLRRFRLLYPDADRVVGCFGRFALLTSLRSARGSRLGFAHVVGFALLTLLVVNIVLLLSSDKDVSKQQTQSSKVASVAKRSVGHRSEQEIVHQKRFGIGLDMSIPATWFEASDAFHKLAR